MSQGTPKVSQKGPKGSQKGAQSEAKGDQNVPKNRSSEKIAKREPKGPARKIEMVDFGSFFASKIDAKIDAEKVMENHEK